LLKHKGDGKGIQVLLSRIGVTEKTFTSRDVYLRQPWNAGNRHMALLNVIYEVHNNELNIIGIFRDRSSVNACIKKLREEFPTLSEEVFRRRFTHGYIMNTLISPLNHRATITYEKKLYELDPKVVRVQLENKEISIS
jgi:hypothetical protein